MREISSKNICSSSFIIRQPGLYILTEDVDWAAPHANSQAIAIECDDVTIDLGGHTIRQINKPEPVENNDKNGPYKGKYTSGNIGIGAKKRKGIVVKNGTILDIQGIGICFQSCWFVDIMHMTIRGCGGNGVVDTTFLYRNGGLFVMGDQKKDGSVEWSSDIRISDCVCTDNTSELDFVVTLGSLVQHSENVEVRRCVFNRTANLSPMPSGVQFNVVGIDFVQCRNVLVEDCEANDNTSGGEPAGFFAWGENYRFSRCRASRNHTMTGNRACGFNISTTSNLEVIDCDADGNYNGNPNASTDATKDFAACGFRIGRAVIRALIENCRAVGNYSVGKNSPVGGFMLNSTTHVVVKNCTAIANRSTGSDASAYVGGFYASTVLKNEAGSFVGGYDNSFIDCIADGNTVDRKPLFQQKPYPVVDAGPEVKGQHMKGAGFILENQTNAKILNCWAFNNKGIGILNRGSHNAVIENNLLVGNTRHGISEEAAVSENMYIGNRARQNGGSQSDNFKFFSDQTKQIEGNSL